MEFSGSEYLFDLFTLAISFTVVSTVVLVAQMTKRRAPGGIGARRLALIMHNGLIGCLAALLPAALALVGLTGSELWTVASCTAALLFTVALDQRKQRGFEMKTVGTQVGVVSAIRWLPVFLLVINIAVPTLQGAGLYASAVAFSLGTAMWSFLRRVAKQPRGESSSAPSKALLRHRRQRGRS